MNKTFKVDWNEVVKVNANKEALERLIPDNTISTIKNYVEHKIPTGGFLRAVLANDFMGSFGRADKFNTYAMRDIAAYIYNHVPSGCHGSYEIVDAWLGVE